MAGDVTRWCHQISADMLRSMEESVGVKQKKDQGELELPDELSKRVHGHKATDHLEGTVSRN